MSVSFQERRLAAQAREIMDLRVRLENMEIERDAYKESLEQVVERLKEHHSFMFEQFKHFQRHA
jgi:hypothetical protein